MPLCGERGQVLLRRRLGLAFACILGPVGERRGAVLEADDEFFALLAVFLGDEIGPARRERKNEDAVLAFGRLDVAVFALGRIRQPEMHAHRLLIVVRPQAEGVVAQVLAGLDVVLVLVGPVELDLLAFVGDGVDARLVDALGEEVAFGVVAAEEAERGGRRLRSPGRSCPRHSSRACARNSLTFWATSRDRHPAPEPASMALASSFSSSALSAVLYMAELPGYLWQQILVEELRHFGALGVHDAVETEVQVGLVELEQLLQQGLQSFVFLAHLAIPFLRVCCRLCRAAMPDIGGAYSVSRGLHPL